MKLGDLAGVKTFKSWGDYFGHVGDNMTKIHKSAFPAQKPATLRGFNLPTPSGRPLDATKSLASVMADMKNRAT